MYNRVECICITCNNCGETFTDDHSGFSIYVDENGAHEAADNSGWYSLSGKHYCPNCHSIDDNDILHIKKLETPRRIRIDLNEPSELLIRKAVDEIEKMGADVKLTDAVILLSRARELVADFIDEPKAS